MEKTIFLIIILFFIGTKPLYTSYQPNTEFIPSQTEILSVQWNGNALTLDLSKEITSYGGGNAMESEVVRELLDVIFSIPDVDSFTLLIEGEEDGLPEGTQISNYTRERYDENNNFCNTK